jgi:hypothetical protein
MQVPLALLSVLSGGVAWLMGAGRGWLVAAVLIGAVVPFTVIGIIPTNHQRLAPGRALGSAETRTLLERWGHLHAVRTTLSVLATLLYLWLLLGAYHPVRPPQAACRGWQGGIVDEDLDALTREQLLAEARRLRAGIRAHRDSTGHALCWHHPALWGLLPEQTDPLPTVPTWPEFLRGCLRYRQSLDEQLPEAPRSDVPYQP